MKGKNIINKIVSLTLAAAMCFSLCGFLGTASAATLTEKPIRVHNGVKVYIETYSIDEDGNVVTTATRYIPQTEGQATVEPFIIEDANGGGTTYLPIRAIANIYGIANGNITWDGKTNTANIQGLVSGTDQTITNPNPTKSTASTASVADKTAYTGVTVTVNNTNEYICKDANGNTVDSYLIDGTTFFPLRALSVLFLGNLDATTMKQYIEWKTDSTGTYAAFIKDAKGLAKAQAMADEFAELKDDETDPMSIIKNMLSKFNFLGILGTGFNSLSTVKEAIKAAISTLPLTKFVNELSTLQRNAIIKYLGLADTDEACEKVTTAQIVFALQSKLYDLMIGNPVEFLGKSLEKFLKDSSVTDPDTGDVVGFDFAKTIIEWLRAANPFKNLGSFGDLSSVKDAIKNIVNKLPGGTLITGMNDATRAAFLKYLGIAADSTNEQIMAAVRAKALDMIFKNPFEFIGGSLSDFISKVTGGDKDDEEGDEGEKTIIDTIKEKIEDIIVTPSEAIGAITNAGANLTKMKEALTEKLSGMISLNPITTMKNLTNFFTGLMSKTTGLKSAIEALAPQSISDLRPSAIAGKLAELLFNNGYGMEVCD